jgi:hypothetical protein
MKQSHILAGVGVAMLVLFYVTSVQREGFGSCSPGAAKTSSVVDGGDLATIPAVASASDCGTKCCENASCNGYTYHTTNKNCHLKSGAVTESAGPGVFTSAIVTRTFASAPLPAAGATGAAPSRLSTVLANIAYLKSLGIPDDGTSANEAMRMALAEKASLGGGTPARSAAPTPTPSSNTSTAGRTDWSDYISKIATVDELKDSLTNTAKSTYGSFWSTIASGIAKFGIVVIVGASIVVGVLIVWSIWRVFLGDSSSSPSQLTGPSLVR